MSFSPIKVMHLIATNFYGGPEKQIIGHLTRLNNQYFQGILVSFLEKNRPNETLEEAKKRGLECYGIPMFGPLDFRALLHLFKLLHEKKIHILCTHGYKSTIMGWCVKKRFKMPVISFSRGYTAEDKKVAFYEWLERKVLRGLTGIICVSEGQKKKLESYGIRLKQCWIIHNAISVDEYNISLEKQKELRKKVLKKLNIPENSKIVVSAGRLSPEKGHRYLIDAITKIKEKNNIYFVFCGDGICKKELEKQAKQLGIYNQCRFPGFRRDIKEIFHAMDLMVLPSLTEGLPNVVLEAFACKKPVVATSVGGVPEIIENGINGFLVPPKSPVFLAKAIEKCLKTPQMMQQMGQAGYNKVKLNFNFEHQTQKLESIYKTVLKIKKD